MNSSLKILHTNQAVIALSGPDALDFLHKMSTNDLGQLTPHKPLATTFLNNQGKIIDHVVVFSHDGELLLVSSWSTPDILHQWLDKYHFAEDFEISHKDINNMRDIILQNNYKFMSPEACESWRIAHKLPAAGHEICDKYMPQEVGLGDFISHQKGCYLGQEVIAKAFTYQKNKKNLIGVCLSEREFAHAQVGQKLDLPSIGMVHITSLAPKFIQGQINMLGLVTKKSSNMLD